MKILFLIRNWPSFGGGETVTKCLANELVNRGYQVGCAFFKKTIKDGDSLKADVRIVTHHFDSIPFDETSSEYNIRKELSKKVQCQLIEIIQAEKYDVIINQWWPVDFLYSVKAKTGISIIKCLHMDPDTKKVFAGMGLKGRIYSVLEPIYRFIESRKHLYECDKYVKNSDLFVFLAPSFAQSYLKKTSIEDAVRKVDFVYNPLVFKSNFSVENIGYKKKNVVVVGRLLEKHKQISRILYAWGIIEKQCPDWNLQIVGDGPDREKYEKIVSDLELNRVTFEGFQNPLPYYQSASIFLMTSAYEGFPMTVIESLQNGVVPIVMDTFSSIHDIIKNGENGYITSVNQKEFADKILFLMMNTEKRKMLAIRGINSCQLYSVENIVNKWETIFSNLRNS